jgi:hypothetical protein
MPEDNRIPEKYQQTHPEIAHWGAAPGEPVRVRDKRNRERVLGKNANGLALGVDFDPITGK